MNISLKLRFNESSSYNLPSSYAVYPFRPSPNNNKQYNTIEWMGDDILFNFFGWRWKKIHLIFFIRNHQKLLKEFFEALLSIALLFEPIFPCTNYKRKVQSFRVFSPPLTEGFLSTWCWMYIVCIGWSLFTLKNN